MDTAQAAVLQVYVVIDPGPTTTNWTFFFKKAVGNTLIHVCAYRHISAACYTAAQGRGKRKYVYCTPGGYYATVGFFFKGFF